MIRAAIDVGSNSILLVVAELRAGIWEPICERSAVTGLGRLTKSTGLLSEPGMRSTLSVLSEFYQIANNYGPDKILVAATMAARIATNTGEFLDRAKAQGTPVCILSGEREAELGFLCVANDPLFADHEALSIVDPGGHSTEITCARRVGSDWVLSLKHSFPIGALALRDGAMKPDVVPASNLLQAVKEIDEALGFEALPGKAGTVVTLGATGVNLVSVREKLTAWQPNRVHGAYLDYEEVSRAVGYMCGLTDSERASIPGLEPGREHTIHAGALILERSLYALHAVGCHVSVKGWRHALLEESCQ